MLPYEILRYGVASFLTLQERLDLRTTCCAINDSLQDVRTGLIRHKSIPYDTWKTMVNNTRKDHEKTFYRVKAERIDGSWSIRYNILNPKWIGIPQWITSEYGINDQRDKYFGPRSDIDQVLDRYDKIYPPNRHLSYKDRFGNEKFIGIIQTDKSVCTEDERRKKKYLRDAIWYLSREISTIRILQYGPDVDMIFFDSGRDSQNQRNERLQRVN